MSRSNNRSRNPRKRSPLLSTDAVATAREALAEIADGEVGEHIGVTGLGRNVATHRFAADVPGYAGWEWNAVVACADGADWVTVNEVALVPSQGALEAPDWVPYSERLRPGDLGPGDIMELAPDDDRVTDDSFSRDAVTFRQGDQAVPHRHGPRRREEALAHRGLRAEQRVCGESRAVVPLLCLLHSAGPAGGGKLRHLRERVLGGRARRGIVLRLRGTLGHHRRGIIVGAPQRLAFSQAGCETVAT